MIYTGLTEENREILPIKSEMYYEFIGKGYLAHETLGVRIEQDGEEAGIQWCFCHNPEESYKSQNKT